MIHLKKFRYALALAVFTITGITHAQTLLYQWNFDNGTTTATTPNVTAGGGSLALVNATGSGAAGSTVVFNSSGGPSAGGSGSAVGALVANGQGYSSGNTAVGLASLSGLGSLSSFTISFWFKMAASTANTFPRFVSIGTNVNYDAGGQGGGNTAPGFGTSINGWTSSLFPATTLQKGGAGLLGSINWTANTGGASILSDIWYYQAITYDGTNVTTYLGATNAYAVQVNQFSAPIGSLNFGANGKIMIGNLDGGVARALSSGSIADVRIYSGAQTLAQILTVQTNAATVTLLTPPPATPYAWKSVIIKGGGFVTGIITHPTATNVIYARTDIGGAYRWNAASNSWISLLDFLGYPNNDPTLMGVESLALDPADPSRLYLVCGAYPPPNVVFTSTNQGATFTRISAPFTMASNNDGRSNGERLAVDPNLGSTIYYGTRFDGLWKSADYGANWSKIGSFPVTTTSNGVGLNFVEFMKSSGTNGFATPTICVGVSQTLTNLYRSTDAGSTWQPVMISGLSTNHMPHHAAQDGLGNMYLTFCDAPGPNGIGNGSVWKLNLATLTASNITPPTGQGGFAGVSVDAQHPTNVLVSTMDRWYPAPPGDQIYRSTNGGAAWKAVQNGISTLPAPWSVARNCHWVGDVKIDPKNSNRAFFVTGYGIIGCTNLLAADTNGTVNWAFASDGLEETVPNALASPPSGASLLSQHADIGGFQHFNLDASPPLTNYFSTHRVTSTSINFAENNPAFLVRAFNESPWGGYSTDGGATWTDFSANPIAITASGKITVSADGARILWIPGNAAAYLSTNNGASWVASTNSPTGSLTPVADRVNPNKFYIYSGATIYVSTNGGVGFNTGGALTAGGGAPAAPFGFEGHLYVPASDGLWRTTNSGATFAKFGNVQRAAAVGFGKAAPGKTYPAIFINGQINSYWGFYRSDDLGTNWTRINDDLHQFGYVGIILGDPRVYGRCYVAASGRGVLYGDIPIVVSNTAPQLASISNQTVNVGQTVAFTANATDTDTPPQTLTFALAAGITNAVFNTNNGTFSWRPLVTQAGSTNPFALQVMDSGTPSLSATQNFQVIVNPATRPILSAVTFSNGHFTFQINGDSGPDYEVQVSTNMIQWGAVFITNSPATPFSWQDISSSGVSAAQFYRVLVGPPLP